MINEPVAEGEGGMQALMQQLAAGMGGARPAYAYLPSFLPAGMPAVLPSAPPHSSHHLAAPCPADPPTF